MKKRLFIPFLITAVILGGVTYFGYGNKVEAETEFVNSAEINGFRFNGTKITSEAKELGEDGALTYRDAVANKFISFKPVGIRTSLSDTIVKTTSTTSRINNGKYSEVFEDDTEMEVKSSGNTWSKILKFNSEMAILPLQEYVEIEFEVETDFVIHGWDKETDFEITEPVRLGDYSYLDPAFAWDTLNPEKDCSVVDEEVVCEDNRIQIKSFLKNKDGKLIYIKRLPTEWLSTAEYPIYTDATVYYGTASTFEQGTTYYTAVAKLDDNKFVVCFGDGGDTDNGKCRVGSVAYNVITWGATSTFSTGDMFIATVTDIDVCPLDTDKFIVVYTDDAQADDGFARAVTVSGTTIGTWGTEKEIETGDMERVSCAQVDTDKAVACYTDEEDSDTGKCVAMSVSGTTITTGTPTEVDGNGGLTNDYKISFSDMAKLGTDKFILCFASVDAGSDGLCVVGTLSTLAITFGTVAEFSNDDNAVDMAVTSPASDYFVLAYGDTSNTLNAVLAGTVSGTTITYGNEVTFERTEIGDNIEIESIDATHFAIVYEKDSQGVSITGTADFSDRSVSINDADVFESGATGGLTDYALDIALINDDRNYLLAVVYQDDDASDWGKAIIGDWIPVVEFTSSIQETKGAGDYQTLSAWENAVECDLTASTTRTYAGTGTGELSENDTLTLYRNSTAQSVTGALVATTSDQILIDGLNGTTTYAVQTGDYWRKDATNYFTVSGTGNDLGASARATAEIDGSWTSADTAAVTINGWTTDANHYIKIYTTDTARHNGTWDETKYRLEIGGHAINAIENFVRIEGLQVQVTRSDAARYGLYANNAAGEVRFSHNIIRGVLSGTATDCAGVYVNGGGGLVFKVWNNVIYDFVNGGNSNYGIYGFDAETSYWHNNTIIDCYVGLDRTAGTVVAKNNLVASTTTDFSGTFDSTSSHNVTTSTPAASNAFGATWSTGTADTNTENKLVNSGATFETDGVQVGSIVKNTTDTTYGYVTAVDGETSLSLAADTFPDGNEGYAVYKNMYGDGMIFVQGKDGADLHLNNSDTVAKDKGVDLSADANLAITDDIDGDSRTAPFDVGADEIEAVVSAIRKVANIIWFQ
jgi:hypothetical protein